MNDDNEELSCEHCSEEATTIESFNVGGELSLCDECANALPVDEYTGERVAEIVASVNGYDIGQETYENEVIQCDWSGEDCLSEYVIHVNGDEIHPDYEDDVRWCISCDQNGHIDDMVWSEYNEEWYCDCCYDEREGYGDRWHNSYRKYEPKGYSKFPVRGHVGIEFEAEDGRGIDDYPVSSKIAVAKEDGSLDTSGTEYCTHILSGDDIREVVEGMCKAFADTGHSLGSSVGWHFHYDMSKVKGERRIKNLIRKVIGFQQMVTGPENGVNGFGYFSNMIRSYATTFSASQSQALRTWANDINDSRTLRSFREYGRYQFVNFQSLLRAEDNRTLEIRLYQPYSSGKMNQGLDALGQDYLGFIRFWDEFIRKSMYRPLKLRFGKADGLYNMEEFAQQFSGPTQKWLTGNSTTR